jgi:hypothetical protein
MPVPISQLLAVALLMLAVTSFAGASGWETVFQSPQLTVEHRPYAGSELQEIRGITRVNASLNALMALLKDADFNRHWVYRSGGAKILQQKGYAQAYVYGIVDAPWPMRDRDTVVRFDYAQHPQTKVITITIANFPEFIPASAELVRVPDFGGFWELRPEANGQVTVSYQVYGNPGGWIPVWLANYAAQISVIRTLQNLPSAVRAYENARSPFVAER